MTCARCQLASDYLAPSDRRCGFGPDGKFRTGSRHCGTLTALQVLAAKSGLVWRLGVLSVGDLHVVLRWRGSGAEVINALLFLPGSAVGTPLSIDIAEELIASAERKATT